MPLANTEINLDVALLPSQAITGPGVINIVVDVLRASSTIVMLFEKGAQMVIPVASLRKARLIAQHEGCLLAGERKGLQPAGFDFGNSPAEIIQTEIADRKVVLTTSNGTRVLQQLRTSYAVLVGSFLNASACLSKTIQLLKENHRSIQIVCAGNQGAFLMDDCVCAGYLVIQLASMIKTHGLSSKLSDASNAAIRVYQSFPDILSAFHESASGRRIQEINQDDDLEICAQIDKSQVIPVLINEKPLRLSKTTWQQ